MTDFLPNCLNVVSFSTSFYYVIEEPLALLLFLHFVLLRYRRATGSSSYSGR